jgi:pyruvate oxidase
MQLGKFHPVTLPVWGEIGAFAKRSGPQIERPSDPADQVGRTAGTLGDLAGRERERLSEDRGQGASTRRQFSRR